jgi:hypothetical protein
MSSKGWQRTELQVSLSRIELARLLQPPMLDVVAIGSPQITEIVAQMRFDFVWVEWEHASMSVERMTQVRVSRVIS